MEPASERGRSPEHIQALEVYDLAVRKLTRHQRTYHCATTFSKWTGSGINYGSWRTPTTRP